MITELAPIALFVYNRVEHTRETVEALKRNTLAKESDLFIFSDGPKTGQEENVQRVRNYINEINGFRNIVITKRDKNLGLANSIILGVTDIVNKYGKIIVLEDDLVCSPDFLQYMNKALEQYKYISKVFSITGYSYLNAEESETIPDTYFLKMPSSWSWGTWKNRWTYFDPDAIGYKKMIWDRKLRSEFNYDDTYDYYSMLKSQMKRNVPTFIPKITRKKHIDSWAIKWYWSVFKQNGLTLFPKKSFVKNIGWDGSGIHCDSRAEMSRQNDGRIYDGFAYESIIEEKKWIRELVKGRIG